MYELITVAAFLVYLKMETHLKKKLEIRVWLNKHTKALTQRRIYT